MALLLLISLFIFFSSLKAVNSHPNDIFEELNNRTWVIDGISSEGIRITFILFQVFAILNGFFMIFFGYRYFRIVIYQTGFISGLLATFCILASRIQLEAWLLFVLSLSGALTFGLLMLAFRKTDVGTLIFTFISGILLGSICIDQIPLIHFIPYNWISGLILVLFGITFLALVFFYTKYEKPFLIALSSFFGSYTVGISVSQIALGESRLALILNILSFPLSDQYEWDYSNYYFYIIFGGYLVLGLIGGLVQFFVTAKEFDYYEMLQEKANRRDTRDRIQMKEFY